MLLELAVGDAYGAGFEYAPADQVLRRNDATHYVKHPRHALRPGSYTDDTQMSLAIAEALVSGECWDAGNLARRFVEVFRRDPREGYSRGFYALLQEVATGEELLSRLRPDSDKSGAAMRAAPLGVLPTIGEVVDRCRVQAAITHDTPDGINAATAAALMAHYFLYDLGPKAGLVDFLRAHVAGGFATPWSGKVGSKGWMSVGAAITAVARNDRLSSLLVDCVAFTGDVDTVAAIALAAASCSREYEPDLPENLVLTLEDGPYGRGYLIDLDRRLLALAGDRARG
jgi:ADP-ribosyl-[dinitrogen reductase] hydrolase